MNKKILAVLLSVVMALCSFSACSQGTAASGSSSAAAGVSASSKESHEAVTLSMWIWDDAQAPAMKSMANAFTAKYPWITIEITSVAGVTDYNTKMQSVIGTADAPDIFWMNFNLSKEYIPMGFVQDLSSYIKKDTSIDMSKLNSGIVKAYTVDNKIYAIPKDTDSYAAYYNKSLFDKAGVAYPDGTWDIAGFCAVVKKVTQNGVVGWTNSTSDRVYDNFIVGNGGAVYNDAGTESLVNSAKAVAAVQPLLDLMNGGYAYTGAQLAETSSTAAFTSNLAAITIDGSWMISQYSTALGDQLGICEIPGGTAGKASCGHGIGYATTTSNKHMDETWKFLAYLASDEAQAMQVEVVIPAANNVASKWEAVYPNLNVNAFVKALNYSFPIPLSATNPTVTRKAMQTELANMLAGQYGSDAQKAMNAAKAAMDAAIKG